MSYKIVSKFIKDISFEIPNPKTFILLDKEIKNYKSLISWFISNKNGAKVDIILPRYYG